jgi:hypothetical protein
MIQFTTVIKKFGKQGEKTGWTYIEIPAAIAQKLKPGNKKSFRVKGSLDDREFEGLALLPMGDGKFILALNASIRKKIRKQKGASLKVKLEVDNNPVKLNEELMECLTDEPGSFSFFNTLTPGHRKYFSNWIDSAKTEATKIKRIAQTINALAKHQEYGQMLRELAAKKNS